MAIPNTTFRAFVEKLGDTEAADFIGNEGDLFYDPNTASLRVSDGVTPGGLPVTGVTTVSGPLQQSLIPDADDTYDLGSPTNQWRDLYLTGNTMYLGGVPVSMNAGALEIDGDPVALGSEIDTAANQRLVVNTDRKIYGEYAPGIINPNQNSGGWYYRTTGGSIIRWNFFSPKPNTDGLVGQLGSLESGWCVFTPWSADTEYPYFQFYTTPKLGGGNAANWYRSKVTYVRAPDVHTPGTPVLLYFGQDPVNIAPGLPRREMTINPTGTEGPQDADEVVFSSYLTHSTGKPDDFVKFSTTQVGFQYDSEQFQYGLYAVPSSTSGNKENINAGIVSASTYTHTGNGIAQMSGNFVPASDDTYEFGSASQRWGKVSSTTFSNGDDDLTFQVVGSDLIINIAGVGSVTLAAT